MSAHTPSGPFAFSPPAAVVFVGLACVLGVIDGFTSSGAALPSAVAVVVIALINRPLKTRAFAAAAVSAGASLLWLVVSPFVPVEGFVPLTELGALGLLLVMAVWHLPVRELVRSSAALVMAIVLVPVRATDMGVALFGLAALAFCVVLAFTLGGFGRFIDERRAHMRAHTQQAERLEIARELHDSVAHHVTGIVVRAQAAHAVAEQQPRLAAEALRDIEHEGAETLASMRRIVAALRADGDTPTDTEPRRGLHDIQRLVDRFGANGVGATLEVSSAAVATAPSEEVVAAVYRIVREALTNVRTHARAPKDVTVRIDADDTYLHVLVSNSDAGAGRESAAQPRDGFGLVGLAERVQTLGGGFQAGPEGGGRWRLHAAIPFEGPPASTRIRR